MLTLHRPLAYPTRLCRVRPGSYCGEYAVCATPSTSVLTSTTAGLPADRAWSSALARPSTFLGPSQHPASQQPRLDDHPFSSFVFVSSGVLVVLPLSPDTSCTWSSLYGSRLSPALTAHPSYGIMSVASDSISVPNSFTPEAATVLLSAPLLHPGYIVCVSKPPRSILRPNSLSV